MGTKSNAATMDQVAASRIERRRASILKRYEQKKLSSAQLTIQLSLLETDAAVLLPKKAPKLVECRDCGGSGHADADEDGDRDRCPTCAGTGREAA